jgi:hypothetical protein
VLLDDPRRREAASGGTWSKGATEGTIGHRSDYFQRAVLFYVIGAAIFILPTQNFASIGTSKIDAM